MDHHPRRQAEACRPDAGGRRRYARRLGHLSRSGKPGRRQGDLRPGPLSRRQTLAPHRDPPLLRRRRRFQGMMRGGALALLLALGAPALAHSQATPEPRTDIPALLEEAQADPAIAAVLADRSRSMESRLRDEPRLTALILKAADARSGERVLDVGAGGGYL